MQPAILRLSFSPGPQGGNLNLNGIDLSYMFDGTSVGTTFNHLYPGGVPNTTGDMMNGFEIRFSDPFVPPAGQPGSERYANDGTPCPPYTSSLIDGNGDHVNVKWEVLQRNVWEPAE